MSSKNQLPDKLKNLIKNERRFIDPTYATDVDDVGYEFDPGMGKAAKLSNIELEEFMRAKYGRSTDIIGYVSRIAKGEIYLRGSLMNYMGGIRIVVPPDIDVPPENMRVEVDIEWVNHITEDGRNTSGDRIGILNSWKERERNFVELPYNYSEFMSFVVDALALDIPKNDYKVGTTDIEDLLVSNIISTPPINTKKGGILTSLLSNPAAETDAKRFMAKIKKLVPPVITSSDFNAEPYFRLSNTQSVNSAENFIKRRDISGRISENSMNFRQQIRDLDRYYGELNIPIPSTFGVERTHASLRKYQPLIYEFLFAVYHNLPIISIRTEHFVKRVNTFISEDIHEYDIDQVYIGPGRLIDPNQISNQLMRISLNDMRKNDMHRFNDRSLKSHFDKLMRSNLELVREINSSQIVIDDMKDFQSTKLNLMQRRINNEFLDLESTMDGVSLRDLINEIKANSNVNVMAIEMEIDKMVQMGVFRRTFVNGQWFLFRT